MTRIKILVTLLLISHISFSQAVKITKKNFEEFNNLYYSVLNIEKAKNTIIETQYLIKLWVYVEQMPDTPNKLKLKAYHKSLPDTYSILNSLSVSWDSYEKKLLSDINYMTDTLFTKQKYVMDMLSTFESYEDPFVFFEVNMVADSGGDLIRYNVLVVEKIEILLANMRQELSNYLMPLVDENNESVIDTKLLATKSFILKYGLSDIANENSKVYYIYKYYSEKELLDAIDDSIPKDKLFYDKYNKLITALAGF